MVGGIDCGKNTLDIALYPEGDHVRVANGGSGFETLRAWLAEHGVQRVGIEASGGYERAVRNHLRTAGLVVAVFDPGRVRHFARAKGQRAKSDPIDARMIAEFTAAFPDAGNEERSALTESLAGLVNARRLLVEKRGDVLRALQLAGDAGRKALTEAADALARVIADLTGQIDRLVAANAVWADRVEAMQSAPGIARITASTLEALLPELGHVSGSRIAALVGSAPFDDDSGQHCGQRHIAGGRADVREVLYMATLAAATRADGTIARFYRRLRAKGKPAKVALLACMRKLIVRLNAMLAKGQRWMENPP